MGLTLDNLKSRVIRNLVGSGTGVRTIIHKPNEETKSDDGNIFSVVWNAGKGLAGFLFNVGKGILALIGFAWTKLWSLIVSTLVFLYNFNWNASDEDMNKQITQSFENLASVLGGTVGNALGWLACGMLPGLWIASFNPALGAYILKNVGEEALDEIAGHLAQAIRAIFRTTVTAGLIFAYVNVRKLWRESDDNFIKRLKQGGLLTDEQIKQKNAERNKPWSLALQTEALIKSIPITFIRNFVEQMLEESAEACIEAGYAVAAGADAFYAMQKLANASILGPIQAVEITFDRDDDNNPSNPGTGISGGGT